MPLSTKMKVFSILAGLFLIPCQLFSQVGGYSTYKFLSLAPSAKITSLGGYLLSVKDDDLASSAQNPALLNPSMDNRYSMNIANYFTDITHGYVGTAQHFKNVGTFAIGIQYVNYGEFDRTDDIGNSLGTFRGSENALQIGYANSFHSFSYGANLKTIFSHFDDYNSSAIVADLGGTFTDSTNGFSAAFVLRNVGTQIRSYYGEREDVPFEALFSVSKRLNHAPFRFTLTMHDLQRFDLTYLDPNSQTQQIDLATGEPIIKKFTFVDKLARHATIGTELLLSDNFNLRVGYNHQKRKELAIASRNSTVGFSWGFGIKIKKIDISYGSARYHLAGSTNMFSLSLNPNDFFKKKQS